MFGFLGRVFGRLGALLGLSGTAGPPATAITLENDDPLLTEDGEFILTES